MRKSCPFATEAEMVACWLARMQGLKGFEPWTVYPETAGWDLLLVHRDGYQLGLEAKLSLNAKVLAQALNGADGYWCQHGPDYRGILVPRDQLQNCLEPVARALGLGVITVREGKPGWWHDTGLPDEGCSSWRTWPSWSPAQRCLLPDYVPDVTAGHSSPVQLTHWKIKAIKLMILLDRRGYVTRADMKALSISPTRWTDHWHGFLSPDGQGGYVSNDRTPDLKAQHPTNYAEIEADFAKWCPPGYRFSAEAA
jgi:hypothetical protein